MKNIEMNNLLLHIAVLGDNFDVLEYLINEQSININTKIAKAEYLYIWLLKREI